MNTPGFKGFCESCGCWEQDGRKKTGQCRANPPSIAGWPVTKSTDWCISGFMPPPTIAQVQKVVEAAQRNIEKACVGFNFKYIREMPQLSLQWLEGAFSNPAAIPDLMVPLLNSPGAMVLTPTMPVHHECDDLFLWAQKYPGSDNPAVDDPDEYASILMYLDKAVDQKSNKKNLTLLMRNDPTWIARCGALATMHLSGR